MKAAKKPTAARTLDEAAMLGMKENRGSWRLSDLPPDLQAELKESIAQADRGELIPAEQVLEELRRMDDDDDDVASSTR